MLLHDNHTVHKGIEYLHVYIVCVLLYAPFAIPDMNTCHMNILFPRVWIACESSDFVVVLPESHTDYRHI